jgi:hypothetical protein
MALHVSSEQFITLSLRCLCAVVTLQLFALHCHRFLTQHYDDYILVTVLCDSLPVSI